jgi:hypothetical protein
LRAKANSQSGSNFGWEGNGENGMQHAMGEKWMGIGDGRFSQVPISNNMHFRYLIQRNWREF